MRLNGPVRPGRQRYTCPASQGSSGDGCTRMQAAIENRHLHDPLKAVPGRPGGGFGAGGCRCFGLEALGRGFVLRLNSNKSATTKNGEMDAAWQRKVAGRDTYSGIRSGKLKTFSKLRSIAESVTWAQGDTPRCKTCMAEGSDHAAPEQLRRNRILTASVCAHARRERSRGEFEGAGLGQHSSTRRRDLDNGGRERRTGLIT